MNKLCVVYNTCGISGRENHDYYKSVIHNLLQQKDIEADIVLSDCLCSDKVRNELLTEFGSLISYSYVDEALPVNVTFNHACRQATMYAQRQSGIIDYPYIGYTYIDSGIRFEDDLYALRKMQDTLERDRTGIVTARIPNGEDSGYKIWFGVEELPPGDFVVPVGKACNGQCNIFHFHWFAKMGWKLMPDIFASFCTESVYSFIAAAIRRKWVISGNTYVRHLLSMDGPSSLFANERRWDHVYRLPKGMMEIMEEGRQYGMGYEEFRGVMMHDPDQYDEDGFCKNVELQHWIRHNLFLPVNYLNYDEIKGSYVG